MLDTDIAYIAGLLDGEAYIGIKKSPAYACQQRRTPGYNARVQIRMVDEGAIRFIAETLGGWYYREKAHATKGRPLYCYQASDKKAENILRLVLPYLKVKRDAALSVLELRDLQAQGARYRTKVVGSREFRGMYGQTIRVANKCFSDEYVAECDALWLKCKVYTKAGV